MKKEPVSKKNNTPKSIKNFWIPLLLFSFISFIIFFLTLSFLFSGNQGVLDIMLVLLQSPIILFFLFLFVLIPTFFIIRRLFNQKPKKVFYFELPIFILIYSFIGFINSFVGLMFGGPLGMTTFQILTIMLPPIIFLSVWLFLLTISLYFYYKKFVSKNL